MARSADGAARGSGRAPEGEEGALAALAAALLSGLPPAALAALLVASWAGVSGAAAQEAVFLLSSAPPLRRPAKGERAPLFREVADSVLRERALRRAAYLSRCARRLAAAEREGEEALLRARQRERAYLAAHIFADQARRSSAAMLGGAALRFGPVLGWYAVLDERTSPECREAHGKNFDARRVPRIGYPSLVHPHCRCSPGAPWPGAPLMA